MLKTILKSNDINIENTFILTLMITHTFTTWQHKDFHKIN